MQGRTTEYRMLHYWVEQQLGKPNICSSCGTTNESKFEWSNISGEYKKDVSDWERLCWRCHRKKDNQMRKRYCNYGHRMVKSNTYIYPSHLHRECHTCRALRRKVLK